MSDFRHWSSQECSTEFVLPKGKARCGIVWMHGLGDTEEGWADMLEEEFRVPSACGPCKFILPRAPRQRSSCNDSNITTSWFDIADLPISRKQRLAHHGCSLEEALASCGRVHAAIDKLISEGIPAERIMVGGFSQGGAMAPWLELRVMCFVRNMIVLYSYHWQCLGGHALNSDLSKTAWRHYCC